MKAKKVRLNRVIDGDTVEIIQSKGFFHRTEKTRIRLWGIDAPESNQKGGEEATKHLARMIGSRQSLRLEEIEEDQYGRTVAIIHPARPRQDRSYNYRMIKDGHAECYLLSGEYEDLYRNAEQEARARRRGIWKDDNRERPTHFRRRQREREAAMQRFWTRVILYGALAAALAVGTLGAGRVLNLW